MNVNLILRIAIDVPNKQKAIIQNASMHKTSLSSILFILVYVLVSEPSALICLVPFSFSRCDFVAIGFFLLFFQNNHQSNVIQRKIWLLFLSL